ncbi:S1C family serine protease [Angustibacter sp. McL0619]|uniref:S1C family serine protease n=1 Tax=Angustibacter sp. McL0619 TaxID=3415676 RepID=UPI003CF98427
MSETGNTEGNTEGSTANRPGRLRRVLRATWLPLAVCLLAVSVIAVVAGVGWSRARDSALCNPRDVASKAMPSVVTILVSTSTSGSNGSGEFLDTEGHILTNNHVISPAALNGGTIVVQRPNGEQLPATLVGRDNDTDLAVIKVSTDTTIAPIPFGPAPSVGDQVFAIGAPLGLADTFTAGVVSALGRSIGVPADNGSTALVTSAIQTDASINPGNSGGTLANCDGELVGVPTAGATANDSSGAAVAGSIGLGFAIPADFAHRIADELIAHGTVEHADFGMSVVPVTRAESGITPDGLYITAVAPGGAAARAGLRRGDIVVTLDGQAVTSADQLQAISLNKKPGEEVAVGYLRDGQSATATLTLGTRTFPVGSG